MKNYELRLSDRYFRNNTGWVFAWEIPNEIALEMFGVETHQRWSKVLDQDFSINGGIFSMKKVMRHGSCVTGIDHTPGVYRYSFIVTAIDGVDPSTLITDLG